MQYLLVGIVGVVVSVGLGLFLKRLDSKEHEARKEHETKKGKNDE